MQYPAVFGYIISTIISILSANVQGNPKSLFETHPQNMWASLIAAVVYRFAIAAYKESRLRRANSFQLSGVIAITSGSLASVSLVSIFLPNLIGVTILYVAWICGVIIIVAYQYGKLFMATCRKIYQEIIKPVFCDNSWHWFNSSSSDDDDDNNMSPTEEV